MYMLDNIKILQYKTPNHRNMTLRCYMMSSLKTDKFSIKVIGKVLCLGRGGTRPVHWIRLVNIIG